MEEGLEVDWKLLYVPFFPYLYLSISWVSTGSVKFHKNQWGQFIQDHSSYNLRDCRSSHTPVIDV